MKCSKCGGVVCWRGQFSLMAHTKCEECGAVDSQVVELPDDDEDDCKGEE